MQLETQARISLPKLRYQNSSWNNSKESDSRYNPMPSNKRVVLRQVSKSIAHAVISHCIKVDAHQIGQEESVAVCVPGAVADDEAVALVAAATWIGEAAIAVGGHFDRGGGGGGWW